MSAFAGCGHSGFLLARCNLAKGARCDTHVVVRMVEDRLLNMLPLEVIAQARVGPIRNDLGIGLDLAHQAGSFISEHVGGLQQNHVTAAPHLRWAFGYFPLL